MVIFGLGNPGRKYERTRHNLGFMVLDELARSYGARFRSAGEAQHALVQISGARCDLVKPMTYMNNSGVAAKEYLARRDDDFLVVFDDIDLPFGRMRIRTRGSDGGHLGMASIIYQLETSNFPRVRMGIGPKPEGMDSADFVLTRFIDEEERFLPDVIAAGKEALVKIVEQGMTAAMNEFNSKKLVPALEEPADSDDAATEDEQ